MIDRFLRWLENRRWSARRQHDWMMRQLLEPKPAGHLTVAQMQQAEDDLG